MRKIFRSYLSNSTLQNRVKNTTGKPSKETEKQPSEENIPLVIQTLNKLKPSTQPDYLVSRGVVEDLYHVSLICLMYSF